MCCHGTLLLLLVIISEPAEEIPIALSGNTISASSGSQSEKVFRIATFLLIGVRLGSHSALFPCVRFGFFFFRSLTVVSVFKPISLSGKGLDAPIDMVSLPK